MATRSRNTPRAASDPPFEAAVWAAEFGPYEWDLDHDRVRWLNGWCQHHRIDPCDGPEHSVRWRQRVHPEDRDAARAQLEAHLSGQREHYEAEYRVLTLAGDWRWIRNRAYLPARRRRRVLIGVCFDVDQRRRLELELERSRRNLEALAAAAPVWMLLLDADGVVEFANRAVRGVKPRELLGRPITSVVTDPAEAQAIDAFRGEVIRSRSPQMYTTVLADGRSIGTWATPLLAGERVTGIASVSVDLSEPRSRERELLEAVAHEQRRFGHDLHDGLGQELTGVALLVKTLLTRAEREAPGLVAGLDEVLDYVTGAIATSREVARGASPVDRAHGGLARALEELPRRWASGPFRFACRIDPLAGAALEPLVADNLYRIAQECLSNAARHSGATCIELRLEQAEPLSRGGVRLVVEDDGRGIRARQALGEGLGLKIMRARADLVGATLRIGGRVPHGTRVECVHGRVPARRGRRGAARAS
jgi:signal transduction histidine kinase